MSKSVQHTHEHPFNGLFSGTTRVSWYQKGKTNLDFTEARDSEWQWHQLGHMQVCTSLQTDNHASTPSLSFLQAGCPSCRPTNSVKALKAKIANRWQTDGGVVDVVVGCDHAQIQWRHIHFIFNADALLKHSKNYTHSPTWCHFTNQQCCEY